MFFKHIFACKTLQSQKTKGQPTLLNLKNNPQHDRLAYYKLQMYKALK